jgi:uncharacterized protein (TIGR00290 family)
MYKTNKKKQTLVAWSSGKDSAWALYELQQDPEIEVVGLFTTVNMAYRRIPMHAVREELLCSQAMNVGLPLEIIPMPHPCSAEEYERLMKDFCGRARHERSVEYLAFGDLFLDDIRAQREKNLRGTGLVPLFPLWGIPTAELSQDMVRHGLRAKLTSIDPRYLSEEYIGCEFDHVFLESLPESIDPCGEHGEFHTFVYDGPMFRKPLFVTVNEIVHRDGFVYADVVQEQAVDV